MPFTLEEEAEAVRFIHSEVADKGTVPMVEAEAVVRSLSIALHADGRLLVPLLRMKAFDQYTTTHSITSRSCRWLLPKRWATVRATSARSE